MTATEAGHALRSRGIPAEFEHSSAGREPECRGSEAFTGPESAATGR